MSRFYRNPDSNSDDDDPEVPDDNAADATPSKFVMESSESDDDSKEKRVVKTQKDKRFPQMKATIKLIKNGVKIQDWTAAQKEYDNLDKQLDKAKSVINVHGFPPFYWKTLLWLETVVKTVKKETKKNMSVLNAKALSRVSAKIKKQVLRYQHLIEKYQKNPVPDVDSDDELPEVDVNAPIEVKDKEKAENKKKEDKKKKRKNPNQNQLKRTRMRMRIRTKTKQNLKKNQRRRTKRRRKRKKEKKETIVRPHL